MSTNTDKATITNDTVSAAARASFRETKDATGDDGSAFESANEAIRALVGERTGSFDQETLTWVFDVELDLWEDNSGGLMVVDRASGRGVRGFERGQNIARLRVPGRSEFTFESDAAGWADLLAFIDERPEDERVDGSLYRPMTAEQIEALYEREGAANEAERVATWSDGKVEIREGRALGHSARWYLDIER